MGLRGRGSSWGTAAGTVPVALGEGLPTSHAGEDARAAAGAERIPGFEVTTAGGAGEDSCHRHLAEGQEYPREIWRTAGEGRNVGRHKGEPVHTSFRGVFRASPPAVRLPSADCPAASAASPSFARQTPPSSEVTLLLALVRPPLPHGRHHPRWSASSRLRLACSVGLATWFP